MINQGGNSKWRLKRYLFAVITFCSKRELFLLLLLAVGSKYETYALSDSLIGEARKQLEAQQYEQVIRLLRRPDTPMYTPLYAEQLQLLSQAYAGLSRNKEAYDYALQYKAVQDSLLRYRKTIETDQVKNRFRHEEVNKSIWQQQIALQQYQSELYRKNAFLWMLLIVSLFVFLSFYFGLQSYLRRQKQNIKTWEQAQYETEIKQLQAIINTERKERKKIFESVRHNIITQLQLLEQKVTQLRNGNGAEEPAVRYFPEVGKEIRATREEMEKIFSSSEIPIPVNPDLIHSISSFLQTIPDQYEISFSHNVALLPLPERKVHHLIRIIQEWVQNMFKHTKTQPAIINLHYHDTGQLELCLKNKVHKGLSVSSSGGGLGLANISRRVKEMNGNISCITDEEFSILISIPL